MTATSLLRLKQQLSRLSAKERVEISAYLQRLRQQSPAWKKEMARRMQDMDCGAKFKLSSRISRPPKRRVCAHLDGKEPEI